MQVTLTDSTVTYNDCNADVGDAVFVPDDGSPVIQADADCFVLLDDEEKEDEDEKKQVSLIYPWECMRRVARGAEEQPHNLLPLQEAPTGKNNQSIKIHKPFSYPEVQRIKRDLGDQRIQKSTQKPLQDSLYFMSLLGEM